MKGSREHKHFLARHRKSLKKMHYDSLYLFHLEQCGKKYNRRNFKRFDMESSL